jgi:glycosyltransferase involved in cell wall biosynthesis
LRVPTPGAAGPDLWLPLTVMPGFALRQVTIDGFRCRWRHGPDGLRITPALPVRLLATGSHHVCLEAARVDGSPILSREDAITVTGLGPPPPAGRGTDETWLHSYDAVIANSRYTAEWIERRWHRSATTLTPPVDLTTFTPGDPAASRRQRILSVGRFFAGGHNKKHDVMIATFRRLIDSGALPDGWELVLAGARHRESEAHLRYYESLERQAAGYPILLRPDVARSELIELYRTSSLYWHAAGFGESETDHPESFEHFGITTCEAMACGLIPVVIACAGPKEIVTDGETGYTFATAAEFAAKTLQAVAELPTPRAARMRAAALASLERFSAAAFARRTRQLFASLF